MAETKHLGIKSMTAFARETHLDEAGELTWELRSINHRYLELFIRLPEEFRHLEPQLRQRLQRHLRRGKLDCTLRYMPVPGQVAQLQINRAYLHQLAAAGTEIAALLGHAAPQPNPLAHLPWPGGLQERKIDTAPLEKRALATFDRALQRLIENRAREGQQLRAGLLERCEKLETCVTAVRRRMPQVLREIRQRLLNRLAELRAELDAQRLEQELVLLAQRLDIDEEMDRLHAHLQEVRKVLSSVKPVGRRLDFFLQELNREANTLGSKSADVEITRMAVEMKVLIEQMREQVQNLE